MAVVKKTTYHEVEINDSPMVDTFDRTDLKDQIHRYWVVRTWPWVGMPYLRLVDGRIQFSRVIERTDVGRLVYGDWGTATVCCWFYSAGAGSKNPAMDTSELNGTQEEAERVWWFFESWCNGPGKEYMERQARWFQEKPWLHLADRTPEEAVAKLAELGW